jgi:hypothetical protein
MCRIMRQRHVRMLGGTADIRAYFCDPSTFAGLGPTTSFELGLLVGSVTTSRALLEPEEPVDPCVVADQRRFEIGSHFI